MRMNILQSHGYPNWDFGAPNRGNVEGTRHETTISVGSDLSRYGGEATGVYTAPIKDGKIYTVGELGLPNADPGVENACRYKVVKEISTENLTATYDGLSPEEKKKALVSVYKAYCQDQSNLEYFYDIVKVKPEVLREIEAGNLTWEALFKNYDAETLLECIDDVELKTYTGIAAPAFGKPGGAVQYETPVSVGLLKEWGYIVDSD